MPARTPTQNDAILRAQYALRRTIVVGPATFAVARVAPTTPSDSVPVVFVPGFAESLATIEESALAIARAGRSLIALESRRTAPDHTGMAPLSPLAAAVLAVIERADAPLADVVAESAGAGAVLNAACEFPERFRAVILLNPAGFQGGEPVAPVAGRFNAHVLRTAEEAASEPQVRLRLQRYLWEGAKWIARNPPSAVEDAVAIAGMDLRPLLERAQAANVHVAILQGTEDLLMPASGPERTLLPAHRADLVELPGGHAMHHRDPARFAHVIVELLAALAGR